ncbi:porin [Paraburkholderia sediminicola]|uniref:Porin n=1 Tax=Paraburkholderia metrosideri TaxID=580937 RepID=A0ABW9E4P7_9BURK
MNRTMICVCGTVLLAAATSVRAQSSVTLYGLVDILVDISQQGYGRLVRETNGGISGSRWGLDGKEDLGSGYKAIFKLEDGFAPNNGTIQQGGALFGRQAWLGISTPSYGALTFGRQYTPEFLALSQNDAFNAGLGGAFFNFDRTAPNGTVAAILESQIITVRTNNSVVYTSPTYVGISGAAMYAFGGVPGSLATGSTKSFGLNYQSASLGLHAGYTRLNESVGSGAFVEWGVGGTYTVGPVKGFLGYTKNTYSDTTVANASTAPTLRYAVANLGVVYQILSPLAVTAQVSRIIDTSDGLPASQNAFVEAVSLQYQISKRTSCYLGYSQVNNKNGSAYSLGGALYFGGQARPDRTARTVQVGLRTIF